jgi:hypothetical protein
LIGALIDRGPHGIGFNLCPAFAGFAALSETALAGVTLICPEGRFCRSKFKSGYFFKKINK